MRAVAVLLVLTSVSSADRQTTIAIGGMGAILERDNQADPQNSLGTRLMLAWAPPPLRQPDEPAIRTRWSFVPEVFLGGWLERDRAEGFLGAGARVELQIAQRDLGLFARTMTYSLYVAARAMRLGGQEGSPFGEAAAGDYFLLGRRTRIGFEFSAMFGRAQPMGSYHGNTALALGAYFGFTL